MSKSKRKNNPEEHNPCLNEQQLTYKCFDRNNYNKDECSKEIENYQLCKSFWHSVKLERRQKGIVPHMPPVEERAKIKAEFFEKIHGYKDRQV